MAAGVHHCRAASACQSGVTAGNGRGHVARQHRAADGVGRQCLLYCRTRKVRQAIPEANPSLYFGMSLGLTFPLNILFGIPLCVHIASRYT